MSEITVTELDEHLLIKGPDRDSVERAVGHYCAHGYEQLETAKPLGRNWIATVRKIEARVQRESVQVTNIGLQTVLESPTLALVQEKIEQLTTYGAVLIAGPEQVDGRWVAVVDDKGVAKRNSGAR